MKFRTFLVISTSLAAMYAAFYLYVANAELLGQPVLLWGGFALPVGLLVACAFAAGGLLVLLFGLSHEAGVMIERGRLRKANRKSEEIEEEYSKGLAAVLEGHEEKGLGHFRAVLERDSRHVNTLIKIGEVLRSQGRYAEAIEYHRKAHHLKESDTRPLYAMIEDHEAQGDLERARTVLGRIIGINKGSVTAWRKLRSLHAKEKDWERALAAHERVRRLSGPQNPQAATDLRFGMGIRFEIAAGQLASGKAKEAVSSLRRLIKDDDQFIPAHLELGRALLRTGLETEAVQAWYHGFEVTGSPIFLAALEEHYLAREQPLAAIEALKGCISRVRKDTLPRFYLGKLYFRLEMLDDAMAVLSSLVGRASYAPTLHYLLGRIHERRQKFRDAAVEYRKVIRESELVQLDYRCRGCSATTVDWSHRCASCGEWNGIEVNFREEIPLEELGLAPAPIYPARD